MLIYLPTAITIMIDVAAWFVVHMGVSYMMSRQPLTSFDTNSWLYRGRNWERNGRFYERFFRVKSWKKRLPDGAALFRKGFEKRRLKEKNKDYLDSFMKETCRAELNHWIVFLSSPLFFIWNLWWVGIVMIVYAALANMPCILTQRYNRIRLHRITG
ncbi:MAG: glycosyl-4,4'-diaponeurosporenoate acyltransferase [Deltaproteobacteria bacterium]|nr:glycosyl-4,4'-diaponeurosporenoate acyltransferase [Deltaproteobacteria bacterium]